MSCKQVILTDCAQANRAVQKVIYLKANKKSRSLQWQKTGFMDSQFKKYYLI